MIEVSFPGIGLDFLQNMKINSTAFSLFGVKIQWYGILIAIGMLLAFFYVCTRAKIEGVKSDDVVDLALFMIIAGVVGSRLYYVIFNFKDYIVSGGTIFENIWGTVKNIFSFRNGGLAVFGGIILAFFVAWAFSKVKKIRFSVLLDMMVPGVALAQGIGRWGNFMNGEAYGIPTDLPWRMQVTSFTGGGQFSNTVVAHPTFLYESVWCILGFVLMTLLYKKKKFNGQIFYIYMIWYGFERAIVEGLRTDSLYFFNTPVRVSQAFAGAIFICGIVLLIIGFVKNRTPKEAIVEGAEDKPEPPEEETAEETIIEVEEDVLSEETVSETAEDKIEETLQVPEAVVIEEPVEETLEETAVDTAEETAEEVVEETAEETVETTDDESVEEENNGEDN